jgi:hypothetical protein
MWVIQELASCGVDKDPSEDRCIIGCGHNWIPKHQFDQTWLALLYIGRSDGFSIGDAGEMEEPYRTLTVKELPGYRMGITLLQCEDGDDEDKFRRLIRLLGITADFKATDPRDKIYALLGISRKIDQAFIPDYCGPARSVFKGLIKFSIRTNRTLECLLGNWDRSLESPLSWIPQLYGRLSTNGCWANYDGFYQAAGGLEPIIDFDEDDDLLVAHGARLRSLKEILGPFSMEPSKSLKHDDIHDRRALIQARGSSIHYERLREFAKTVSDTEHDLFGRTLVMDQDTSTPGHTLFPAPSELGKMQLVTFAQEELPNDFEPQLSEPLRLMHYTTRFSSQAERCL